MTEMRLFKKRSGGVWPRYGLMAVMSLSFLTAAVLWPLPAMAQEDDTPAMTPRAEAQSVSLSEGDEGYIEGEIEALYGTLDYQNSLSSLDITPEYIRGIPTLFFTKWQHALLVETRAGARSRPVSDAELDAEGQVVKGPREIGLSGILFTNSDEWVIWLNNQRVAPDAIPEAVMDMNVSARYVEIEWFDAYTNQIYPIRLRPHQRFNLDSRIFLPGSGTASN